MLTNLKMTVIRSPYVTQIVSLQQMKPTLTLITSEPAIAVNDYAHGVMGRFDSLPYLSIKYSSFLGADVGVTDDMTYTNIATNDF